MSNRHSTSKTSFLANQLNQVSSLFKVTIGNMQPVYARLTQRHRDGTCRPTSTNQQNVFTRKIKIVPNAACNKTSAVKILTMHAAIIVETHGIDRSGNLRRSSKRVTHIGQCYFMWDRYRQATKIRHGTQSSNNCL